MNQRASSLLLALLLTLSLTACGGQPGGQPSPPGSQSLGGIVDLPVLGPEEEPPDYPQQEIPDRSQSPGNEAPGNEDPDTSQDPGDGSQGKSDEGNKAVDENGWYTSKEEVALYIHLYDRLPDNYVTKDEAEDAGWSGGNVERWTGEGTAIGGSRFGNREGLLPKAQGRVYTECDIDTVGGNSRGAKRIVFSNDGLIFYTDDHYESFELLYGEP